MKCSKCGSVLLSTGVCSNPMCDNATVVTDSTVDSKLSKVKEVQSKTYEDMCNLLSKYGRCNVVRPTGFGKTKTFMQFVNEHKDLKFLYVYDTKAILNNIKENYVINNVDFISYSMLSRKDAVIANKDLLLNSDYTGIIFDESHLMGANNIKELLHSVLPKLSDKGCLLLGGTATELRTDLMNVTNEFFEGHKTFEYSLYDAINDGIIVPPVINVMLYNIDRINSDIDRYKDNKYTVDRLKQLEYVYAEKIGAHKVYRDGILRAYGEAPSYMKFIAFYPTIKSMNDNLSSLLSDFQKAFPEKTVTVTPISSDIEHIDNYEYLDSSNETDGIVEIFACVDMLNQGYHSTSLTGVIFNRTTMSNIIYTQQLGRCMSVMSNKKTVVFDNVGNCMADPLESLKNVQNMTTDIFRGGYTGVERDFRHFEVLVDSKEIDIVKWYNRIIATANVTQGTVNDIKRLYNDFDAPVDYISKKYKVPEWLIEEECCLNV